MFNLVFCGFLYVFTILIFVQENIQMSTTAEIPEDKNLNYDQLVNLKKQGNVVLIDVREPKELQEVGTLPDSYNIPLAEVEDALKKSPEEFEEKYGFKKPTFDTDVVFSCRSGKRSLAALRTALALGYNHAGTNTDFFQATIKMSTAVVVSQEKVINYEQLIKLMQGGKIVIIDVREPIELQRTGIIPHAFNIPLGQLEGALKPDTNPDQFQKQYGFAKPTLDTELIFSCQSGNRSGKALQIALSLGYHNAKHYSGGWVDWNKHNCISSASRLI